MIARNARLGALGMYEQRWLCRKIALKDRRWKMLRNLIFPRLTYHWIYATRFGLRAWWVD